MRRHNIYSLPVEINRSYMRALRELLGLTQYAVVRHIKDDRMIRESQVSVIEGKIGYEDLWPLYASYYRPLIEADNGHTETIKELMRTLLKTWEEA